MPKKKKQEEYHTGRFGAILKYTIHLIQQEPHMLNNFEYIRSMVYREFPELADKSKCINCERSMKITEYEADLHDGMLILAMAKVVRHNMTKGMNFTEANQVDLGTLPITPATYKRSTKCDYLNFIKQPESLRNTGYWVITTWGWKALRGEAVPKKVKYWNGNLIERSQETTTLSQMFKTHTELVERAMALKKAVRSDYRADLKDYDPRMWSEFGGVQEGRLL